MNKQDRVKHADNLKLLCDVVESTLDYFGYNGADVSGGSPWHGLTVLYINTTILQDDQLATALNMQVVDHQAWFFPNKIVFSKVYDNYGRLITRNIVEKKLEGIPLFKAPVVW